MVSNLVAAADNSGIEYSVAVRQPGSSLAAEMRAQGITVAEPPRYFGFRSMHHSLEFLRQVCRENQIQLIHAHLADAAFLGWMVARKLKLPLVISHHGDDILLKCNPVCRFVYFVLLNLAVRYAAMNIAVSRSVAERVRKLLRVKKQYVQIIHNGVLVPASSQLDLRKKKEAGTNLSLTIVSVGRLVPLKGQRQLIYAVARLATSFPDIRLYIVGGGDLAQKLIQLAENEKVGRYIEFTGAVDDVSQYLAKADIYVSSSQAEGLPVSILEAMAWRLPVVASDIPGNRNVVKQGETGFLYELNNINSLVDTIVAVANDHEMASAVAARARLMIEEQYSAGAAEQKFARLYRSILE